MKASSWLPPDRSWPELRGPEGPRRQAERVPSPVPGPGDAGTGHQKIAAGQRHQRPRFGHLMFRLNQRDAPS